jgi:N-acetylmuramoyl-L-alanine amidase
MGEVRKNLFGGFARVSPCFVLDDFNVRRGFLEGLKPQPPKEKEASRSEVQTSGKHASRLGPGTYREKTLRVSFGVRRVVSGFVCAVVLSCLGAVPCFGAEGAGTATTNLKRQAASAQFARAEEQRAALNEKAAGKRSLADYKQVVSTYRHVYLITPHAAEVPESLVAIAELSVEMGDRFGRSYYQEAVDAYRFLVHEYPTSKHGQDAMLRVAELQRDQLGDPKAASKTYDEFLKKYPRAPRKREAQEARAELALLERGETPIVAKSTPSGTVAGGAAGAAAGAVKTGEPEDLGSETADETPLPPASLSGGVPRVRRITTKASGDSTRVTIDLEDTVQYSSARIRNPDRIFFDIHAARLTLEVAKASIHVEGELLTAVRAAQNHAGIVRVVLDVNGVKDYTATLQDNPPELIIDLYPNSGTTRTAKTNRGAPKRSDDCRAGSQESCAPTGERGRSAAAGAARQTANDGVLDVANVVSDGRSAAQPGVMDATPNPSAGASSAASLPSSLVRAPAVANGSARSKSAKGLAAKPDLIQPASSATPTRDGQSTLTRALGLKIGRIVIDAGHGGHDTGTIGPTGLMEKDLCLDVALRLGKIIQQRLPGADVVYTRSDDTFIPLEERTHVANEAKADLFISIHANSSHDHGARGIETYYLNLKGSPDAMEVASRENATAQESIHDLEDLVKKIARSEKIDESREFAADIQESLAKRIQKSYKPVKDRGVRKAPFVVLIGADMPSILTEISFLSNPADEQLLKKPDHRQRVAEGIYQGVAEYLQSLNSMTGNLPRLPLTPAGRSAALASVDSNRNQR